MIAVSLKADFERRESAFGQWSSGGFWADLSN
jgi:hypothetical protein